MKRTPRKIFNFIRESVKVLLIILIFSTVYNFWYINQERGYYQQYVTHATELRILVQEVAKDAGEAIVSNQQNTFENLKTAYTRIEREIYTLKNGILQNGKTILPPSPSKIKNDVLNRFSDSWDNVKPKVKMILDNRDLILGLNDIGDRLINNIEKIKGFYQEMINELGSSNKVENKKIVSISRQINLIERMVDNIQNMMSITGNTAALEKAFLDKIDVFFAQGQLVRNENVDSGFTQIFNNIEKYLQPVREDVNSVNKTGGLTTKIHTSTLEIFRDTPAIANLAKLLQDTYGSYIKKNTSLVTTAYIFAILSFLALMLSINLYRKENEYHLKMTEEKNMAMQIEVEKLLRELPEIASGNASAEMIEQTDNADDSDMITESFYYALNTLRKLVYNIGKTARNVSMAALDAQKITKELAISSGNQAQEIVEITASVSAMATSIEKVSTNASESAAVALESVNIAGEGSKVVQSTISGMERIQTQIQETSNYMRRLSDSSLEIGEIVSLIDGIADQTNILSLNASIQAAMAGEAGRGFAVVADEVQRLAEKVSYATKEIGSLVRSIQTDTSQVIQAMEQTKSQVLEGVNFAQDAGSTLEKIETVSRRLSDLIQNISLFASEQVGVSGKISHIMNDVKDIAKQTASGSMTTVDLIGNLMQFVTDLRNSVFELKLPEEPK